LMSVHLSRWLVLEELRQVPDGAGGYSETWMGLGGLWAEVVSLSGRESGDDLLTISTVPYRVTVRAAPYGAPSRPRAGQRFRDGERKFAILAVSERDTAGRYLTCNALEKVSV
jgi:head-tail adaptor